MFVAPTGFGKTVIAAWIIAQRKTNALILVHRKLLMDQWREHLGTFLDLPIKEIGIYCGSQKKLTKRLDIAVIQSLYRRGEGKGFGR